MQQKISILIIEDEKSIRDFMKKTLESYGYRAEGVATGTEGLGMINSYVPDLVLLDLGLPDLDGLEIIEETRKWSSMPIIVISARNQENEKVEALDLGADDYITKPFGTDELLARIRTAIRHNNLIHKEKGKADKPYIAKSLKIDFEKRLVLLNGEEIHLTRVEYKIVSMLAKNSGKILTYANLIEEVWGPHADDNNRILRVNMANIRRKLEQNTGEPEYIFTELGVGYRMLEDEGEN